MNSVGKVFLVGAGPGAADLLTIRAQGLLQTADLVLHDRLVSHEILDLIPESAEVTDVGKRRGDDYSQQWIFALMAAHARNGRTVIRLKGGDPMVFGRGGEEIAYLSDAGIPVEVVPGITSAIGVPTSIGLPLTLRGVASGMAVVAGEPHEASDWGRYARVDTLVILMGVRRRAQIAGALLQAGRRPEEAVAFIENGTTDHQRVTTATLEAVAAGAVEIAAPSIWVLGEVVRALPAGVGVNAAQLLDEAAS